MLRDLNFFRRNGGKKPQIEETENVPPAKDSLNTIQVGLGKFSARAPLNTIQTPKSPEKQPQLGVKTKIDTTPTKPHARGGSSSTASNGSSTIGTPEKQLAVSSRNKFGWAHKNETETRDEGKSDVNHLPPSRSTGGGYGGLTNMTPRSVRTVGRPSTAPSECSSTHSTPTKSVTKPPNPGVPSRPPVNTGARAANFAAQAKGITLSCASPSVVNTTEVHHFDLKEDPSFWMDHNVQVLIRVRPPNSMERSSHGYSRCLKQESAQTITWIGQPETRFTFDHVACETVNQEMLFRVAGLPMVENCLSGYNSCMFAYGQTGSGKTYTMLGEINELEFRPCQDRGMTPRIFEFLFARIRAEEESRRDEKLKYNCKCSFLEIYNEQIADLLDSSSTNLLLREDIKNGVYVENLTEYDVRSVSDILKLLTEGAANRKVAATNMNRESSRSHSVFTCVIESRWEKDSTTNLRFARLNLVDLAGSERQKTSGAEGERLKEAANINKSLSTLGHVIMLLVDVAQGKLRHIPYRDSRLTFLLQESLGGNSKTMIIANVSPSICCAAETLSTLKFAQRAKLIQNNAIINEDASGDLSALQHQIQMLKEELSVLKRRNVSRSLSFCSTAVEDADREAHYDGNNETSEMVSVSSDDACERSANSGIVRVSTKQLKSLEATLAGALRREQMADSSIKQLEAEIGQLNRLVNQREEDTRCTKMMLRFREDKIQRMESLLGGSMPTNGYLLEENNALAEELQLLRVKIDRNPEVTRFALENIRLLDKLRRFQEFYEEGEKEMLLAEVSELRNQLLRFLDGNNEQYNCLNSDIPYELKKTNEELDQCRYNLSSCMEINSKLTREINDLNGQLDALKSLHHGEDADMNPILEPSIKIQAFESLDLNEAVHSEKGEWKHEDAMKHTEEILNLQLELDILKTIFQEERLYRREVEERALGLSTDLDIAKARYLEISMHCQDMEEKLNDSRSVIEALESQQILMINELEGLRDSNNHYLELFSKQEHKASALKKNSCQELRESSSVEHTESKESNLQFKLKRMQDSLDTAKRLNTWYQSDQAFQTSHEQEMDEVRRQVEVETAEVILCLQEELTILQEQVNDCNAKEIESKDSLLLFEMELKDLKERLGMMTQDNKRLSELVQEKDEELKLLSKDWETLAIEMEEIIADGHVALKDASDQVNLIASSFPPSNWIREQVGKLLRNITEKESLIEELQRSLEEAQYISVDMDRKLRSLKGAALAMTEVQQQESSEKEKVILQLTSQLSEKASIIKELEKKVEVSDDHLTRAELCATVAFVIVNRMSEIASDYRDVLKQKDTQLNEIISLNLKKDDLLKDRDATIGVAEKQIRSLRSELEVSEESCVMLKKRLSQEEEHVQLVEKQLADMEKDILLKTRESLDDQFTSAETCATVSFVIVNKLSEMISDYCDVLKQKDTQLNKAISLNVEKDIVIEHQVAAIDRAETQIQALRRKLEVSEESYVMVKQKLIEEAEHTHITERKLESIEKDIFLKMRESVDDQFISAETCATMAFVLVSKLSEITSYFHDVLKQKDTQLDKAISLNLKKEALLEDKVAAIDRAEKQIQALGRELEVSEERYVMVKQKLSEEEKHVSLMERKLDVEKDILLKTKEKLDEFKLGVSSLNLCMNEYAYQKNEAERIETLGKNNPNFLDGNSEGQVVIETNEKISKKESQSTGSFINGRTETYCKVRKDVKDLPCEMESLSIRSACEDAHDKDLTIHLLRKEIESALVCLKQVETQMIKLFQEKEEIKNSEKQNKRSMECFTRQLLTLQSEMCDSEEQLKLKIMELEQKILKLEESTQEAKINWLQKEEVFELELSDAKVVAMQKTVEVGSLLVKFEEVQETMKEADVIINALVIANGSLKFETERLKEMLVKVINERDFLNNEVQFLQLSNDKKDQLYANLEKQFLSDLSDTGNLVVSLEDTITEVKEALEEQIESILCDFNCFKAQILDSTSLTSSWLEDIWSEIIVKDCAVSVLHLCHMGVLLEAVNGLNVENGLLHFGLCESNSVIINLKEHNLKATKELEMFKTIKGKLLVDIKNSFDRILRKEDETRLLSSKLSSFEKKILDLQFQEELMLARSNLIGSEISHLTGELDTHNTNALAALSNQIKHLKDQEELTNLQVEFLVLELTAKEFESLILASELLHTGIQKADLKREQGVFFAFLEDLKKKLIFLNIETDMKKQLLMDTEVEVSLLKEVVGSNVNCCINSFGAVANTHIRMFQLLDGKTISLLEKMFNEICENREMVSNLIQEFEYVENFIEQLTSENMSFQSELSRKDEVLKGMLFDLSLLQESASNAKDQKDDVEEIAAAYESLEDELVLRSAQLDEAFAQNQMLEAQLQEKLNSISALELDLSKKSESLKLVTDENFELKTQLEYVLHLKSSIEEELKERHNVLERLEEENIQMDNAFGQMNTLLESLKNDLDRVTCERDGLSSEVHVLKEKIEMTEALAEENEARANEAQQIADTRKIYAEDKEEEVKLLERSVEELESTVNVLEDKVDIVKGEAERQRLLREKLETELMVIRNQMITVTTPGTTLDVGKNNIISGNMELQSCLEEKDRDLQKTRDQIQILEKSIAEKDAEISQCREHISELNLHAEAQAYEYKQKFKALEAMAEQVKPDPMPSHGPNSSSSKLEKNATKSRGSGSPFKCIGLGLSQQIKSEKDEELTAGRLRIEELEALIASRQKEIFLLNARLAAAESMTHDVIRDLLGVKLDMNNYASLLDHQQVHRITQKAQVNSDESLIKEQELITQLKQQLNEFVEERQGWLDELSRRQTEMVAAQIASEKLRQREQFLTTENEMLKKETASHKKKVMELEDEVKKLSGQQNLQQRIHHHAKIKEENNLLKSQNEDLRLKLRRMETILSRLKEEATSYRANGRRQSSTDFDEERLLNTKLKEIEEEKFQLRQKLLCLCTSILQAAGITCTAPDISLSRAEAALEVLKERISSLERESEDLKFKNKLFNERARLSDIKQQSSSLSSTANENCMTPERAFQTPLFTALDR